jgi:pimeloyl-ACP methyl ester carboxylesterase
LTRVRRLLLTLVILAGCSSASAQERVNVATPAGVRFAAEWTDAGRNAPAALLFPMCWQAAPETWAPVAAALKARGVSTLVTTYPGWLGNSPWPGPQPPPEPQNVYWNEQFRQVRESAFAFVTSKTSRQLVVGGSSCGVDRALDVAADHRDRVAGVVVFAGAHTPRHLEYVRTGRVPVLGLTSRGESQWVIQHDLLVKASGNASSRLIIREEGGHGTVLLKDRAFAAEIAGWISDRLSGR